MKRIKTYLMNKSIGYKLIFYFFIVILGLIITITTLGNLLYKESINHSQNENTNQIIKQINNGIDVYIKNTENIINYMSTDPRILNFFQENKDEEVSIDDEAYKSIYRFTKFNPEIAGIMIVNVKGGYVSDVMNKVSKDSLTNEQWYLKAYNEPKTIHLFTKPIGRNINNIFQYSADEVFSVSKAVIDPISKDIKGVILIDIKLDIIKEVIENAKPGTAGFIYILDDKNDIVYTPINKIVYRIKDEWIDGIDNKVAIKNIDGDNYQLTKSVSDYTGWQTIGVFPESEGLRVIKYIRYYSIIIGIIALIIAEILVIIFTKSIVNPILKLKKLMKKAQEGDLTVSFNSKYNDEIGELGGSFNNMVKEINNLINLVHIEEKKKRIAEMNVLQAQIKPHFMYNTLDTIRWMAEEHNEDDIVEIIEAFTNLLRISLSKGKEIITVKEELKHIEGYLTIQKIRYEDKLNYKIEFDENILDYKLTKLILQPLIENSIYHGIKEKRGVGNIIIIGKVKDEMLYFSVSDNGKGIDKQLLNKINNDLLNRKINDNKIGYGIFNVNERIQIMYGKKYGLTYKSIYGEGTIVEVRHPIIQ
ncbi:cache domain-containing sensor histidine kinase [Clostridium saccharobutylicum]|uniref:Sensor histidine kinase YesM n=1 Tax=Clostridium saccharobutylicum DSM 13864 TaxID=1345695 RepID=U5MQ00_CLOSA|nr:sensor histidine kinase [Clostridium saccharobutylicum]AGX41766.1 sensor histidine kinase YesM [Clostridium saccharobutylicum DSM 13864]MBA2903949.1 two-component system sensor histidine kinase YesM [Clostridium saccharobutylicum]MBA8788689.1 two-component system sensor histidine kinase YesM [Clostridium saccharobutylicum]MBA8895218.1 two-component system sensor histidine kinase YesM [Clostridium saccharobutylicum]MBA8982109.1 two-component system sensor histidine kinase YesM [Clostridium s